MAKYIIDTNTCIEYFKHVTECPNAWVKRAATDNLKHFIPMPGVEVENWIKRPEKD